jgi:hypothetical protein
MSFARRTNHSEGFAATDNAAVAGPIDQDAAAQLETFRTSLNEKNRKPVANDFSMQAAQAGAV